MDNKDTGNRLSRLEVTIENMRSTLDKIQHQLDERTKVNWAPIAIGVTIFFTVAGSVSTIYNTRISTLNTAVEQLVVKQTDLEKGAVERQLRIQSATERNADQDRSIATLEERVRQIEIEHNATDRRR